MALDLVFLPRYAYPLLRTAARVLSGVALLALVIWAYRWPYRRYRSSLKNLPGECGRVWVLDAWRKVCGGVGGVASRE
jgi:hypothetical protein